MTGRCHHELTRPPGSDAGYRRILWFALLVNGAMFAAEVGASFLSDSVALQADSLDFLGDTTSYAVTLFVLAMGPLARTHAALSKAAMMGTLGLWVASTAIYHAIQGVVPEPIIMGPVAMLGFAANLSVAALLYRHRGGDSNRRSIWLCSRNDAIGNLVVLAAALGVWGSGTGWPDYAVASIMATLGISAAVQVIRQARRELTGRTASTPATAAAN